MKWARRFKKLSVKTNAEETPEINKALEFGAEGIGLCRTEHMFLKEESINKFRKMIVAEDPKERQEALDEIATIQQQDFE
jgi:pyruvate,orthophosphate dikinase